VQGEELTGSCLCGGVRFEVTEPPVGAGYCHCSRCQKRTGTASSVQARLAPGSLRVLAGEDLVTPYRPPDGNPKFFCSACGGALWSRKRDDESVITVRMGVFDRDPGVRPSFRQYVDFAAGWEPIPDDGLQRYPGPCP
jgi:hypothetical protein